MYIRTLNEETINNIIKENKVKVQFQNHFLTFKLQNQILRKEFVKSSLWCTNEEATNNLIKENKVIVQFQNHFLIFNEQKQKDWEKICSKIFLMCTRISNEETTNNVIKENKVTIRFQNHFLIFNEQKQKLRKKFVQNFFDVHYYIARRNNKQCN